MAEADGTGAIIREYLWLEDLPLAATDISGGGTTLYYIHASHRGEPVAMTNASKTKVWDASYAPFGAATIFTATTQLDLRLPGQQLQGETGLHQNWMRDYDPSLGRYGQPDPIGLAGGPNVYSYVGQDPLTFIDPSGENPVVIAIIFGALLGGGADLLGQYLEYRHSGSCGGFRPNLWAIGVSAAFGGAAGGFGVPLAGIRALGPRVAALAYNGAKFGAIGAGFRAAATGERGPGVGRDILGGGIGGGAGGAAGGAAGVLARNFNPGAVGSGASPYVGALVDQVVSSGVSGAITDED